MEDKEHLSCDHRTLFIIKDDTVTVAEVVLDEAALREGKQDYCWENVAVYRKTWSKEEEL